MSLNPKITKDANGVFWLKFDEDPTAEGYYIVGPHGATRTFDPKHTTVKLGLMLDVPQPFSCTVAAVDVSQRTVETATYPVPVTPPPGPWPASFYTGPAGQNTILPPKQGCLIGLWPGSIGDTWADYQALVAKREQQVGRQFDILGIQCGAPAGSSQWFSDAIPFGIGHEDWIRSRGATPYITFTPGWSLADLNAGKGDAMWHDFAKRAKAWGHQCWLRAFHEFNLPSGPIYLGEGAAHISAWRRMVAIFKAEGASNVSLMWCPHEGYYTYGSKALNYPGDDVVDWVSSDDYSHGDQWCTPEGKQTFFGRCEFDQCFHDNGSVARDFEGQKPYFVGETGCRYDVSYRNDWLAQAHADIKARFPNLLGFSYFDEDVSKAEPLNNWLLDAAGHVSMIPAFRDMARDPYFNPLGKPLS